MSAIPPNIKRSAFALLLSMSALPNLVNALPPSLTSVNKDNSSRKNESATSANKAAVARLFEVMLASGADSSIANNLAPIIGLPNAMPIKAREIVTSENGKDEERRACYVVYENAEGKGAVLVEKHAVCAYFLKSKRSGHDPQTRYFRIDLTGKLEKVVLSQLKYDDTGKVIRGSGVKFDQDIESSEVKKTFEAEMKFWLKDWLKKERKPVAKTTAANAPKPTAAAP